MKILVLGSGVVGVTAAYELGKRGHQVTVLDRQPESGRECSFATGGQLSYNAAEPWATHHVLPKLPGWLLDPESPLVFRLRADWQMLRWGVKFLLNCTPEHARANCVTLLRLGLYSRRKMDALRKETGIAFDYSTHGVLHIAGSEKDFDHAKRHSDFQAKFGGEHRVLGRQECLALEPALAHSPASIVGGIHAYRDECGDTHLYSTALSKIAAERYAAKFHYGLSVEGLRTENGRVTAAVTDRGDFEADAYVMALGSYSSVFLRRIGIDIPVYPMKGYSITVAANEFSPQGSITDGNRKIVYTRLGDRLRVAGTAELAGYNDALNERRIVPIVKAAKATFPKIDWDNDIQKWACLRPTTPDGPPFLGKTPYNNLFLNTGHGTLGWTQAAGSAAVVADCIEGKPPEILLHGLEFYGRR